jgi:hypothetical protein
MSLRTLCAALYAITALIASANASSITIYYDPAAWLAAINAFGPVTIGPYGGNVTETYIVSTAETNFSGNCCTIINRTSYSASPFSDNFHNLEWGFTQLGDEADIACFGVPDCTFSAPTELIIDLNPGIVGFYSLEGGLSGSAFGSINGEVVDGETHPAGEFFGAVGAISVLDFSSPCQICDTFGFIIMNNIQVAIPVANIVEPSALACLLPAFLILTIGASKFKRRGLGL